MHYRRKTFTCRAGLDSDFQAEFSFFFAKNSFAFPSQIENAHTGCAVMIILFESAPCPCMSILKVANYLPV